jgi:hypothetical protein
MISERGTMIGTVVATIFLTFILWIGYQSTLPGISKPGPSLPVPISVGKERFTGRTNDASSFTTTVRRKAVVSGRYGSPCHVLHETPLTSGFTNGVLEYSLSGLCEVACKKAAEVVCTIYDGGFSGTENPIIIDGGTSADVFEGGDAFTTNPIIVDGGGEFVMDGGSAYFTLLNYMLLSGGNAQTNVCETNKDVGQSC